MKEAMKRRTSEFHNYIKHLYTVHVHSMLSQDLGERVYQY